MPFYEYVCELCGKDFVLLQSIDRQGRGYGLPVLQREKSQEILPSSRRPEASIQAAAPAAAPGAAAEASKESAVSGSEIIEPENRMILRLFCAA